jgi:cobyrinic acid a,c-diamide synthase
LKIRRIVVAGVTSGVGKTTIALALMYALRKKGLLVQPFKVGPDFIDPSYHAFLTGRLSRNLDVWMMGKKGIVECFASACKDADVAVIEGVMGLYDGLSGKDSYASTAHVARILDSPVLLVVDAAKGARSIAAVVLGFLRFDKTIKISGIVLNNVAGARHATYITEAFHGKVNAPIVGIVKRSETGRMDERHLGLIPAAELQLKKRREILAASKSICDQIDVDRVLELCGRSPIQNPRPIETSSKKRVRVAVALDESFNFYYSDNLDAIRKNGAQLIFFSPVNDAKLPEGVDGIMLGGGFPEVLADELEDNTSMMKSIRAAVEDGAPVYGECGGLMYFTRSIRGYKGQRRARKMAGLIDADTMMTGRLTLNYTMAECDGPIFGRQSLKGHEFHYSRVIDISKDSRFAYSMQKGFGVTGTKDGFVIGDSGIAAYMHLHFANNELGQRMVEACVKHSRR